MSIFSLKEKRFKRVIINCGKVKFEYGFVNFFLIWLVEILKEKIVEIKI